MEKIGERIILIMFLTFYFFLLAFFWFIPLLPNDDERSDKAQYDDDTVTYIYKTGK